jgi:hypothetical protein
MPGVRTVGNAREIDRKDFSGTNLFCASVLSTNLLPIANVCAILRAGTTRDMPIRTNTRTFLAEAATAVSMSLCWHRPVETGSQADYVPALAEGWMR